MASVLATDPKPRKARTPALFGAAALVLLVLALIGVSLLVPGATANPMLQIVLGIGICLLTGLMAWMLWEMARRLKRLTADQEARVREQTAQLIRTNDALETEIRAHRLAQKNAHTQLDRLNLLHEITRTIGERHDIASIFPAVLRSLEERLPVELCAIWLYNGSDKSFAVAKIGSRCAELAAQLGLAEHAAVPVDKAALALCVQGEQIRELTLDLAAFPLARQLCAGGLRSLVLSPLRTEGRTIGALVTARTQADGFTAEECKFLRRLGEHVARALNKAQLYGALQQAYDDLRQSQGTAAQQERLGALAQMANGMGHYINNALSPMMLYTESLLETEPELNPRVRDSLATIRGAISDMARTVARMREFCRPRDPEAALAPIDPNRLVQHVVEQSRAAWSDLTRQRGKAIEVRTELAQDVPPIAGIEGEMKEALASLVTNAVEAMPGGGTLTLRTRIVQRPHGSDPGYVQIEVTDTGIGMDETARRRCLEPFASSKGERGSGLGLSVVHGIVRRHGGEIDVRSAKGRGTTVLLTLPAPAFIAEPAARSRRLSAAPPRLRLLLVDDDPLFLKSLGDTLEADGHIVTAVSDGQSGIDAFQAASQRRELFSAVITDLGMPYVDGHRVAGAVKEASPATPVILLTGWTNTLLFEEDTLPHIDRVVGKPPRLRELRETLAELCRPEPLQ
jgi:signal transduction histidine kinase/CheY-like chemotaxis protein